MEGLVAIKKLDVFEYGDILARKFWTTTAASIQIALDELDHARQFPINQSAV